MRSTFWRSGADECVERFHRRNEAHPAYEWVAFQGLELGHRERGWLRVEERARARRQQQVRPRQLLGGVDREVPETGGVLRSPDLGGAVTSLAEEAHPPRHPA